MSDFDPHFKLSEWNKAYVIDDLKTRSGCMLKCLCFIMTYLGITPPMEVFGQGAKRVADLLKVDVLNVIKHFCDPGGSNTPEPLVRANLLNELGVVSVGDVQVLLSRLCEVASNAVIRQKKIFIMGLTYSNSAVGHCVLCVVKEDGRIICGCEPEDLANVRNLAVYTVPDDIKKTWEGCDALTHPKP